MTSARPSALRRIAAGLVAGALLATCAARTGSPTGPAPWASPGLVGGSGWPYSVQPLDPTLVDGASYVPDSSVIRLADGSALLVPFGADSPVEMSMDDPRVTAAIADDRAWLSAGTTPGGTTGEQQMAARALLDLRALTAPNGANVASWYGAWAYVWPRDAAFTAAAFAATGHITDAMRVLEFLAQVQNPSGLWAARYQPDGTAVNDGRRVQLDGLGWMLWGAWLVTSLDTAGTAEADVRQLWPMITKAADEVSAVVGSDGLPPPSSDYFERPASAEQNPNEPTLGVVAPLLSGMRAATLLGVRFGTDAQTNRWDSAADRLWGGLDRYFKPFGYPRSPVRGGAMDASVAFLAPPFELPDQSVAAAVTKAQRELTLPSGGLLPSATWSGGSTTAWTPETALFALSAAASGRSADAQVLLNWLQNHRTSLGSLPEKVDAQGRQASVAPLGWTSALTILALYSMRKNLPIPPP